MSQQTTSINEVIRIENLGKTFVNKGNSVEALIRNCWRFGGRKEYVGKMYKST